MHYVEPIIVIVNWRYDRATGRLSLLHDTAVVHKLEPRLHHLLNYFLQHPAQIISKDQLMDDVWPEGEGTDAAVMRAIASLRKILQPGLADQACIETLSKRGYRWLLPITEIAPEHSEKVEMQRVVDPEAVVFPAATTVVTKVAIAASSASGEVLVKKDRPYLMLLGVLLGVVLTALAYLTSNSNSQAKPVSNVYSQQLTISALAGNELSPLLTAKQDQLLYHYQLQPQNKWRWLLHDLSNNRQQSAGQTFDVLGQGVWLDDDRLLFQARQEQKCHFFIQSLAGLKSNQPATAVYPCEDIVRHGLVRWNDDIYWLATATDQSIQLWRRPAQDFVQGNASAAKLEYQFEKGYRRGMQLLQHQQHLYLLIEKDFASTSLFQLAPRQAEVVWLQDFKIPISHLARWHGNHLLLATRQGPMTYDLKYGQMQRLQTAQGLYSELYPQQQNILAVSLLDATSDILPLELAEAAAKSTVSPWLNSNKNEYQLVAFTADHGPAIGSKLAFVSERSGMPQIWLQQQEKLQQLTNFKNVVKISQLIWHQGKLLAFVDDSVVNISLTDGSIVPMAIGAPSRLLSCQQQLYWTAWSAAGWALFQLDATGQAQKIRDAVVDARCGPDGQLVLAPFATGPLQLWLPGATEFTSLPVQLNWRAQSADSWLTAARGLYWLEKDQLWLYDWTTKRSSPIATKQPFRASEIYLGIHADEIYYKKVNELQADVIWLHPAT